MMRLQAGSSMGAKRRPRRQGLFRLAIKGQLEFGELIAASCE